MLNKSLNTVSEDEISIKDVIDFLVESWKIIVLICIAGGLLGLGYAETMPVKYQATASIQVAKVAGADVESPALLIEKLKMPMYYSQKTYEACNLMENLAAGEVIANSLNVTLIKATPIITISYRERSPEDAKKCLEGVLDTVRVNQGLLAKPIFESKTNQLVKLKLKLKSEESIAKALFEHNPGTYFSESKFDTSSLLLAIALSKENELKDLRNQINDLEFSLQEPQTAEAFFITQIYASTQKVSPKRIMIVVKGLIAGLFIGLLLMMVKRTYGAYKSSNHP